MSINFSRYPTNRTEYTRRVGKTRENNVRLIVEEIIRRTSSLKDWEVLTHDINTNGPDITVLRRNKLLARIEIMNEDHGCFIDKTRAQRIRKNLKGTKIKGLIVSNLSTIGGTAKRILKNIPLLAINFQTLPKDIHIFYNKRREVFRRKKDSNRTRRLLKNRLLGFLGRIGLLPHMYMSSCNANTLTYRSGQSNVNKTDYGSCPSALDDSCSNLKSQTKTRDSKTICEVEQSKSRIKTAKCKEPKNVQLFCSLFKNDARGINYVYSIPFENKSLMALVQRRTRLALSVLAYEFFDVSKLKFKNKYSEIDFPDYIPIFTKDLFDSLLEIRTFFKTKYYTEIPDVLYLGMTTHFLDRVISEGNVPDEAKFQVRKKKGVILTNTLQSAMLAALVYTKKFGGKPVIILVKTKHIRKKLDWRIEDLGYDNLSVFDFYLQFVLSDTIPTKDIKNWYIFLEVEPLGTIMEWIKEYLITESKEDN